MKLILNKSMYNCFFNKESFFMDKNWWLFWFHVFLRDIYQPEIGCICPNRTNNWDKNVPTISIAQASSDVINNF